MRVKMRVLTGLAAVIFLAGTATSQSQLTQNPTTPATPSQDDVQAMIDAAKPGPMHEQLMKRAGEYTFTMKFFTQPGAEPLESSGTATLKSIIGGRFLEEENSGETLGQPYAGERLYGYNNGSKHYEAIWIYNGSTAFLVLDGTSDDGGKTVRYTGAFLGPGGAKQVLHVTIKQTDADHFVVRLIGDGPEGSVPVVETTYTRKR